MSLQISIHGRLGREPKSIETSTGNLMAVAPVAVNVPVGRDGDPETLWFDLMAFGRNAEMLLRHKQGEMINAMGNVQINQWTDQKGETRQNQQVLVEALLSARTTRPGGGKRSNAQPAQAQRPPPDFDDDLDF